jgi:uncharacterized protein YyaL (SSP411 family)
VNHLASEPSPYFRQHADNPVDWYPWGEEALALARRENKPILLSIGYSTCHWCHVMAQESFEDAETACLMNAHFVNIKVDREERPDLDHIYQTAHFLLTGRSGGWPLTMFLAPDQTPFFGGTYFPKHPRYDLPGFKEVLIRVAEYYHAREADILRESASLRQGLAATLPRPAGEVRFERAPLKKALDALSRDFDPVHGGFGGAPKFPRATEIAFCLRRYAVDGDRRALDMARLTLKGIVEGGIHDQIGGGFCRYSVDERWMIPHFEKMLYDNAALLEVLADAWRATGEELFRRAAEETVGWAVREMGAPEGGFYSALDADSDHEEGRFYVWEREEIAALLSAEEYAVFAPRWGLDRPANFEGRFWHLYGAASPEDAARAAGVDPERAAALLASARGKLFAAREKRSRPGRDEKILAGWNALMIKALARVAWVFERDDWLARAFAAADFLRGALWREGRLYASWQEGQARHNAYLDDLAFLLDALLELIQARFRPSDLEFAAALAEALLSGFEDRDNGGFYFTHHDQQGLIHRPKPGYDNATPSGNGVAAFALQRLGHLLGESRYLAAAKRALALFYPQIQSQPAGFLSFLLALEEALTPPRIVILRGPGREVREWRRALARNMLPDTLIVPLPNDLSALPPALAKPPSDAVSSWVCQGTKCLAPIEDLAALRQVCRAVSE